MADAIDELRNGGDVIARNRTEARRIAEAAGGGPPIHEPRHGNPADGHRPHYHPTDAHGNRIGGDGSVLSDGELRKCEYDLWVR